MEIFCEFIDCSNKVDDFKYRRIDHCDDCRESFCRKHLIHLWYTRNDTLCDRECTCTFLHDDTLCNGECTCIFLHDDTLCNGECTGTFLRHKCIKCTIRSMEMKLGHQKCYDIAAYMISCNTCTKLTIKDLKNMQSMPIQLTKASRS